MSFFGDLHTGAARIKLEERKKKQARLKKEKETRSEHRRKIKDFNLRRWSNQIASSLSLGMDFFKKGPTHHMSIFWIERGKSFFRINARVNNHGNLEVILDHTSGGYEDITAKFADRAQLQSAILKAYKELKRDR